MVLMARKVFWLTLSSYFMDIAFKMQEVEVSDMQQSFKIIDQSIYYLITCSLLESSSSHLLWKKQCCSRAGGRRSWSDRMTTLITLCLIVMVLYATTNQIMQPQLHRQRRQRGGGGGEGCDLLIAQDTCWMKEMLATKSGNSDHGPSFAENSCK